MRDILNKSELRRVNFVETLYFFGNNAKRMFIINKLDYKEPTLRADIEYLNEKYSDIFLIAVNGEDISLTFNRNVSMATFYKKILNISPILCMAETLFFEDVSTIDELAESQFTSVSTIYRMIDKFNESASKSFDITIDTKTLNFQGEEKNIRSFFIQFFAEKYPLGSWPFKHVDKASLYSLVKILYSTQSLYATYSDLEQMVTMCAVNIERIKKNHKNNCINVSENAKLLYDSYSKNEMVNTKINKYLEKLGIDNSFETFCEIFCQYLNKYVVYNFDDIVRSSTEDNSFNISLLTGLKSSYKLITKYGIKISNLDDLIVRVHNSAVLYGTSVHSKYILYKRNHLYVEKLRIDYPKFVKDLEDELRSYLTQLKGVVKNGELDYLIYIFASTWEGLIPQLFTIDNNIKALSLSRFNYYQSVSVKNQIEYFFQGYLDVDLFDEDEITLEKIENSDYDLVIADFTAPIGFKKRWVYYHGNRSIEDFKMLIDIVYEILNNKTKLI